MKVLLLTLLLYSIPSLAKPLDSLGSKLLALGAECNLEVKTVHFCVLEKGSFGYPNKTAILFHPNSKVDDLLIHLHGYSFGPLSSGEDFDSTPDKMISSFKFIESISHHPTLAMVIPFTTGKCTDYDAHLAVGDNFESYIEELKNVLGSDSKVHLSAHSGGGRTLAKTINRMKTVISSVSLFDAIYSSGRTPEYQSWIQLNNKTLNLIAVAPKGVANGYKTVKGLTPFNESQKISIELNWKINFLKVIKEIGPDFFHLQKENQNSELNFLYEETNKEHHHWIIVRDSFPLVLNLIMY